MTRHGLMLVLLLAAGLCFCLKARPAGAQGLQLDISTGGGELAYGGGLTLSGAMLSYGLPDANRGVSSVGVLSLRNNFYPALSFALGVYTAADPLWLRMEARGTGAPEAVRGLASALGRGDEAARMLELEPAAFDSL